MSLNIRLMSDIHVEFQPYTVVPMDGDDESVLVLPGDLGERTNAETFVRDCCEQFKYVIYVHGNHEYYNGEIREVRQQWHDIAADIPNLYFMDDETVVIENVRFICSVLWTDFGGDWFSQQAAQKGMNDFYCVRYQSDPDDPAVRKFTAQDASAVHKESKQYIIDELEKEFDGTTIVVTHHSPSMCLVGPEFAGSSINAAFHSNCDDLINDYKIDYWFFGHTHRRCEIKLGDTWVHSNQRGYAGHYDSIKAEFEPEWFLLIE